MVWDGEASPAVAAALCRGVGETRSSERVRPRHPSVVVGQAHRLPRIVGRSVSDADLMPSYRDGLQSRAALNCRTGSEIPIPGVAQSGHNKSEIIQLWINRRGNDLHVGMS